MSPTWHRAVRLAVVVVAGLGLLIQLVPYGRAHTNPPVREEPRWDAPETRELARRACFACHSHETAWPWYASVAPASWLIQRDVDEGRRKLNFSGWDRPQREASKASRTVDRRSMPPWYYTVLHPDARLTEAERIALTRGLELTTRRGLAGEGASGRAPEARSLETTGVAAGG